MQLTNSQKRGESELVKWFNAPNDFIYTLYGVAGTGKTTLLNSFLKKVRHSVCVTAPTHKAVRVVENITSRKGRTLQSLLGFRPNFNLESFNVDNVKYDRLGNIYIQNYKLVIIDEASQISESLQKYIEVSAKQYRTKILYVGDKSQLPPIKEKESQVFSADNRFELIEIVRQSEDNPMLKILGLLREDVVNGTSKFLNHIHKHKVALNDNGDGYVAVNEKDFKLLLDQHFNSHHFRNNIEYCRYAAWTNESVLHWNNFIRHLILPKDSPLVVIKDVLTGYKTIIDEFSNATIINSEDYIVTGCRKRMSDDNFIVYSVILQSIHSKSEVYAYIVDHTDKDSIKNVYNVLSKLHAKAVYAQPIERGKRWMEFYRYKDRFLLLKGFPIYDNVHRNEIRGTITKDIDYGYGLTIHKLQGSTIQNIFVNSVDVCYYKNKKGYPVGSMGSATEKHDSLILRNKLLYTAISRASNKAIILI